MYRESSTKTTCYSFEYTISHTVCQQKQKKQYHDAINYIRHLQEFKISEHHTHSHHLSSIEDSAEWRVLRKTNTNLLHTRTIQCNDCIEIKSTHFKKLQWTPSNQHTSKKQMGTVNRRLKPHEIHLNRCIGTHPPTCLQDEIDCTPQLRTSMPLPHPPAVSTRPLPSGPDKIERCSDSRIIFATAHAFQWKQHIYVFRAIHHIDPLHRQQTLQFSKSHGQTLQKSSLVSRTFSVHISIWMFTLCTMHLVSTSTSDPRKEVLGNLYNFMH